jgi:hypothetical protein
VNNGAVLSELTSEAALRARPGSCVAIEVFWMHRLFQRIQAADPGDPAAGALSATIAAYATAGFLSFCKDIWATDEGT